MAHYVLFYQLANVASQLKHVLLGSRNVFGARGPMQNCFRNFAPELLGMLKLEALANGIPEGELIPHSFRSGGTTSMFHSGFGLFGVKEWGRLRPASFQGYLRYDIGAMRFDGAKMAIATGLVKYTMANPRPSESVTSDLMGSRKAERSLAHPSV